MTKFKNIALAVASMVIFTNITNAQAPIAGYSVNAAEPLRVKYLGEDGEFLIFQVTIQSNKATNALFAIDNKNVEYLYSSRFRNMFTEQRIKIAKSDDDQVLNFKLFLGRKKFSKSFSVNTNKIETTIVAESDITML